MFWELIIKGIDDLLVILYTRLLSPVGSSTPIEMTLRGHTFCMPQNLSHPRTLS